jgi:hypothetical protein
MSKSSPILGKRISAMMDGGWEISGEVTHDKSDRVLLKTESGDVALLFKKKISGVLILRTDGQVKPKEENIQNVEAVFSDKNFVLFKGKKKESQQEPIKTDDDLSEGGISLPHEVLISVPTQSNFRGGDDDFSISMTSLFGSGRVSVTSDDESK